MKFLDKLYKDLLTPSRASFINEITKEPLTTNEVIEQIHDSFEVASDVMIKKAETKLANTKTDDLALRKERLGFGQAKGVKENQTALKEKEEYDEMLKNVLYFQQSYPQFKVIHESQVEEICKKYNLVLGGADLYRGDIPEKNIKEIENFQKGSIKEQDLKYIDIGATWGGSPESTYSTYLSCKDCHFSGSYIISHTDYSICAPLKDMDTKGQKLNGYKLEREIPDPVVLFPLRDKFYAIVSKWGLEGQDQSLTNEKSN